MHKSKAVVLIFMSAAVCMFAAAFGAEKVSHSPAGMQSTGAAGKPAVIEAFKIPWLLENQWNDKFKNNDSVVSINEVQQKNGSVSLTSGPVRSLPWDEEEGFIKARTNADTPVLMGAYRTVLRDPLPGEEYNVHLAASMLKGMVLMPGESFSQNGRIGPYTEQRGFRKGPTYIGTTLTTTIGGGVCKIASTLYNVTVLSNLEVVERHCHSMPVPYVPYGQDATVAYGARDYKFRNNTDHPILIWAQGIDNVLYIAFYGKSAPPKIEWQHEISGVQKAPVVYRKSGDMPAGTEKMVLEGMDGATVKSWILITSADGKTDKKQMRSSYYMPMPSIVEKGG